MNRVHQPRPLVVLGLNVWMGTAAGADELVEIPTGAERPHGIKAHPLHLSTPLGPLGYVVVSLHEKLTAGMKVVVYRGSQNNWWDRENSVRGKICWICREKGKTTGKGGAAMHEMEVPSLVFISGGCSCRFSSDLKSLRPNQQEMALDDDQSAGTGARG